MEGGGDDVSGASGLGHGKDVQFCAIRVSWQPERTGVGLEQFTGLMGRGTFQPVLRARAGLRPFTQKQLFRRSTCSASCRARRSTGRPRAGGRSPHL